MAEQLKEPLKLEFNFTIKKKTSAYEHDIILNADFKETIPKEVDVIKYAKKRIAEEMNRQAANFASHKGEKSLEEKDPLLEEI